MRYYDEMTPLARAEEIVRKGPNPEGGPVPCEDEDSPTCFTFQQLNRARYSMAECGCQFEGADRIALCKTHDIQGAGPKVSYEETAESFEDQDGWMAALLRGVAEIAREYED